MLSVFSFPETNSLFLTSCISTSFSLKKCLLSFKAKLISGNEVTDNIVNQLDNEWYTFVTNDKINDTENKTTEENEQIRIQKLNERKKIKKTSIKVKKFNCATCQKQFTDRWNLANHERIHTGEAPYVCNMCKKRFKTKYVLKNHERIHTGEVPYECRTCKKTFKTKSNLEIHERIHTGEVPFECKTCKKRFKRKDHLKQHERIHSGEVPFECKTCKKRFNQISALKIHERIHSEKYHMSAKPA